MTTNPQLKTIKLTIDLDLLIKIWNTRKPNQSIDSRIEDLIVKGLETQKANDQFDELIREGKVSDQNGEFKQC